MGVGIETSSHIHGFLHETVLAYEIVTADGNLVRATPEENADLFYTLPWSHGTLGFLVAVELKVVEIKRYVKLDYIPYDDLDAFAAEFKRLSELPDPPVHLEALVFSENTGVIMTGNPQC